MGICFVLMQWKLYTVDIAFWWKVLRVMMCIAVLECASGSFQAFASDGPAGADCSHAITGHRRIETRQIELILRVEMGS